LVGGKGVLDHPIRQDELDRETAYNTYKIDGLPPTPIANPGRAAIEAVLKPAKTKDLYFVADGSGGHAFAPSLDDHNRNVAQWRKLERAMREKARAEAAAAAAAGPDADTATPEGATASGELTAPDALLNLQSSAAVAPVTAPEGGVAAAPESSGEAGGEVPLPLRNPQR